MTGSTTPSSIDIKPALDEHTLDARLLRDLGESPNRGVLHNVLDGPGAPA